jgi:ribosome-binding protein aMBF1 (putative translation factor)
MSMVVPEDRKEKIRQEYDSAHWNQEQLATRWGYPVEVIRSIVLEEPK